VIPCSQFRPTANLHHIILDEPDGCRNSSGILSPREQVRSPIKDLVNFHLPRLHPCVTNRSEFDIRATLGPFALHSVYPHESRQKNDIVNYVHSVLETTMKSWREQVKKAIVGHSQKRSTECKGIHGSTSSLLSRPDFYNQVSIGVLSSWKHYDIVFRNVSGVF
jgi:hypothetical protein